jgi:hypothetical protein
MDQEKFTRDEIWSAVLSIGQGGNEDLTADELIESKKILFDALDKVVAARPEPAKVDGVQAPAKEEA